jgi:hypothetical protein
VFTLSRNGRRPHLNRTVDGLYGAPAGRLYVNNDRVMTRSSSFQAVILTSAALGAHAPAAGVSRTSSCPWDGGPPLPTATRDPGGRREPYVRPPRRKGRFRWTRSHYALVFISHSTIDRFVYNSRYNNMHYFHNLLCNNSPECIQLSKLITRSLFDQPT